MSQVENVLGIEVEKELEPPWRWRLRALMLKHFRSGRSFLSAAGLEHKGPELSQVLRGIRWPDQKLRAAFCSHLGISRKELKFLLLDGIKDM